MAQVNVLIRGDVDDWQVHVIPKSTAIVVFAFDTPPLTEAQERLQALQTTLVANGYEGVLLALGSDVEITAMSEEDMAVLGWVRKDQDD